MDDVTDYAGVGVGRVYRRCRDKELAIEALLEDRLGGLGQASLSSPDPRRAASS
jgi:AcrR family transcriptional regulator